MIPSMDQMQGAMNNAVDLSANIMAVMQQKLPLKGPTVYPTAMTALAITVACYVSYNGASDKEIDDMLDLFRAQAKHYTKTGVMVKRRFKDKHK